jgi:hypothetical protein
MLAPTEWFVRFDPLTAIFLRGVGELRLTGKAFVTPAGPTSSPNHSGH